MKQNNEEINMVRGIERWWLFVQQYVDLLNNVIV